MSYNTIEVSVCCNAKVYQDYDEAKDLEINWCDECQEKCEITKVCEYCNGTGETGVMEQVFENEPHYASTGIEKCICTLDNY